MFISCHHELYQHQQLPAIPDHASRDRRHHGRRLSLLCVLHLSALGDSCAERTAAATAEAIVALTIAITDIASFVIANVVVVAIVVVISVISVTSVEFVLFVCL